MSVITAGERELALRFAVFPDLARAELEGRIRELIDELESRVEVHRPVSPGRSQRLRSEIRGRVFADNSQRIAGYVSVLAASGDSNEYAKAATLEYGSDKARRIFEQPSRMLSLLLTRPRRRLALEMTRAAHIEAYAYLREPLEEMRPEIEAALEQALATVAAE